MLRTKKSSQAPIIVLPWFLTMHFVSEWYYFSPRHDLNRINSNLNYFLSFYLKHSSIVITMCQLSPFEFECDGSCCPALSNIVFRKIIMSLFTRLLKQQISMLSLSLFFKFKYFSCCVWMSLLSKIGNICQEKQHWVCEVSCVALGLIKYA